ncbi:MAG: hypothetical protein Edafosvirus11_32 [Edafosvirus sp.]|uniref:RING-type domain-containing protein n=1 Tax=Edafosvirus sp. TaxID=2487765 RepID=A0A3G4ZU36_9VIRU|nr:MAG: hypothetical protein Edafosvirus11_32 [Edafosvirus sp.]
MLNSKYFTTIHTEEFNKNKYQFVKPLGNPMILFSKIDGSPLASLHMISTNDKLKALITARDEKKYGVDFQGIINKADEEFSFVINNLTDNYIYFNILKEDNIGINQINCLKPYQSCEINCDKKDNNSLILSYIKKSLTDTETKTDYVTVETAEKSNEYKGTYYYISVVPEKKKKQMERFKETIWLCVDMFCMKTPNETEDDEIYKERKLSELMKSYKFNMEKSKQMENERKNDMYTKRNFYAQKCSPRLNDINFTILGNEEIRRGDNIHMIIPNLHDNNEPKIGGLIDSCLGITDNGVNDITIQSMSYIDCDPNLKIITKNNVRKDLIEKSYIGQVKAGRKMVVNSVTVDIQFEYSITSCKCKIGLSIEENLEFKNDMDSAELLENAKKMFDDIIKDESKILLPLIPKIYESDMCIICCQDNKDMQIDMIFYQCGHQCCHYECGKILTKCPLCQQSIIAIIHL